LKAVRKLRRIIKNEALPVLVDVDLILTLYSLPATAGISGIKRVTWEHFNFYYQFPKNNKLRRLAMRLAARFSHVILVLTHEDQIYYQQNLRIRGRLCQIYNPDPFEGVIPGEAEEKMVLAAGRLTHAKGFDLLLESWSELEPDFPGWSLSIAGEGEDRPALEAQIEDLGLRNVKLLGQVPDIEGLYQRCGFFVLSSRNEGFGMVLIEAMAFGKPVVSFDCKAGPRDIVADGENGFLVTTGDCRGFAQRMRQLMESEHLRGVMGKRAKSSLGRFSLNAILDQWEALLKTL